MNTIARSPGQLGQAIQRQRKAKGLSQSDLARLSGQRQEKISRIESGYESAKLGVLLALLAALDLELSVSQRTKSSVSDIDGIF